MNVQIGKGMLTGNVDVISSKSHAHRLLIGAALAKEASTIVVNGWSDDMEVTKNCLNALGAHIVKEGNRVAIEPIKEAAKVAVLDCGESGSTLRFLIPLVSALGCHVVVEGRGRLPERPLDVLLVELRKKGVAVEENHLPLEISGQLESGIFTLPANVSSQFITGLLFALPILDGDSEIHLTTEMESRGYINMTLEALETFGIIIEETDYGFFVKGNQTYSAKEEIFVEGDWSGAAFWCVAGGCGKEILCTGLKQDSTQGDMEILSLMEAFGATVTWEEVGVHISPNLDGLQAIDIDARQIPDLVPILCVAAATAEGTTKVYNAGRLRIKESDRLQAMADGLSKMGVSVEEKEEEIYITGRVNPPNAVVHVDGYNDHRIVMALAVAATVLHVPIIIEGAEAVAKSYPNFFSEFVKLGGVADVI
ncbi:3-phosphoshikimate 1-carboxyvinyltransferase [Chakrabartyella piscis]|uniref:3-phosphoshikimate 1-carboxyvinyltransferase n=1 Tax=Chakrabartyella piscis TaxID=2918914 RepID=UPI0029588647|nr:3-phosphoshikimate 1-carboxyvinyltransferase [Chakrabartyella piscis]